MRRYERVERAEPRDGRIRGELYQDGLGARYDGLDRGVDIHLSRLRKKLVDQGFDPGDIKCVRGVGYLLARRP